jgi:hypothetical protein
MSAEAIPAAEAPPQPTQAQAPGVAGGAQPRYSLDEIAEATTRAVIPRNLDDVLQLAQHAAKSGLFGVRSVSDAYVRIVTGLELGITSMAALRTISVFNGKPILDATLIAALCKRSPDCLRWTYVEITRERCTIETRHRRDGVQRLTWTMEDAKDAKLDKKDVWRSYPRAMLRSRCITEIARMVYPGVVAGIYTADEAEEMGGEAPLLTSEAAAVIAADDAEKAEEAQPLVDTLLSAIDRAETDADLQDVAERIRAARLQCEPRKTLREAYSAKQKALKPKTRRRGRKAAEPSDPGPPSDPDPSSPGQEPERDPEPPTGEHVPPEGYDGPPPDDNEPPMREPGEEG